MTGIWALAALWLGLALIASLLSIWLRVSTALSEIIVGTVAQLIIGAAIGSAILGTDETWIKVLSGTGAIVLTFLAGAELDPTVFKRPRRLVRLDSRPDRRSVRFHFSASRQDGDQVRRRLSDDQGL